MPALEFYYYRIALRDVTPRGGPAEGGTTVVVVGSGLASFGDLGSTLCRFGTQTVRAVARDETSVTCTAPNTCDPLTTTGTACPTRRTSARARRGALPGPGR